MSFSLLPSRFSVRLQLRGSVLRSGFGSTFGVRFYVRGSVPRSRSNLNTNREVRTPKRELPLSLFVLRIRADHAHDAAPAHDLALVANLLHRRSYLHKSFYSFLTTRPRVRSRGVSS